MVFLENCTVNGYECDNIQCVQCSAASRPARHMQTSHIWLQLRHTKHTSHHVTSLCVGSRKKKKKICFCFVFICLFVAPYSRHSSRIALVSNFFRRRDTHFLRFVPRIFFVSLILGDLNLCIAVNEYPKICRGDGGGNRVRHSEYDDTFEWIDDRKVHGRRDLSLFSLKLLWPCFVCMIGVYLYVVCSALRSLRASDIVSPTTICNKNNGQTESFA